MSNTAYDYSFEESGYEVLKGPDGFECYLTEPEDRSFGRDLNEVVVRLNKQHQEILDLKSRLGGEL